ncbi:TetR/AcrR family transcriptional regulator [[Clostridium] hylemonae]|uniref:Transcriptional regulator, TetR family n=1 Tax=[Clostridium] hylemonae DSM 15053 TaxID=553973 RepID=C0C079_9FIRM|nr:transcriptional regulator, TetR family [[Clostridium] hylemonae DSM 15053]
MQTLSIKGDKTKMYICSEAYKLFAEKGFKEVTMQDICRKTDLSRGGLYRHYENTAQIFSAVISGMMAEQEDEFSEKIHSSMPAAQILDDVLNRYEEEMLDSGNSLSVAIYEYFSSPGISQYDDSILQQYLYSKKMWTELITYGMRTGEFKIVDPAAVFDLIVFSYQGVRMYSRLMPVHRDIPRGITGQIRNLLLSESEIR